MLDDNCMPCNRRFENEEALQQHLRYSPAHVRSFSCDGCARAFDSEEALRWHLRNTSTHAFHCDDCDLAFDSDEALQQRLQDPLIHHQDMETPLDVLSGSFPMFDYDLSLPPATSYTKLRKHEGWRHGSDAPKDAWNRFQDALQSEPHPWYGAENDLAARRSPYRAINIKPRPKRVSSARS